MQLRYTNSRQTLLGLPENGLHNENKGDTPNTHQEQYGGRYLVNSMHVWDVLMCLSVDVFK